MSRSRFVQLPAVLGEHVGVDLWGYQSRQGGGIRKGFDFIYPYMESPERKWPYEQIKAVEPESYSELCHQMAKVYAAPAYESPLQRDPKASSAHYPLSLAYAALGQSPQVRRRAGF